MKPRFNDARAAPGVLRLWSGRPADHDGDALAGRATGAECLDYLSDMIGQLRGLADRAGYPTLARILDRAHLEATDQRKRS